MDSTQITMGSIRIGLSSTCKYYDYNYVKQEKSNICITIIIIYFQDLPQQLFLFQICRSNVSLPRYKLKLIVFETMIKFLTRSRLIIALGLCGQYRNRWAVRIMLRPRVYKTRTIDSYYLQKDKTQMTNFIFIKGVPKPIYQLTFVFYLRHWLKFSYKN